MKFSSVRSLFRAPEATMQLQALRKSLLNALMVSTCVIGAVLYILGLIPVFTKGLVAFPVLYTLLYIWLVLITFDHRIPYWIRASGWLFIFYALGLINLFLNGWNVDAGLFFLSLVAVSTLLVGFRGGLASFAASGGTLIVMSFFIVSGRLKPLLGLPQTDPLVWIIGGVIFVIMGGVLILTLTTLLRGLQSNLEGFIRLSNDLELSLTQLRESEERYRNLVELSSDWVVLIGLDKRIVSTNQLGPNWLDYRSTDQLVGRNLLSFISPGDHARIEAAFARVLETGSVKDIECTVLRQDGTPLYAAFSSSVIVDSAGKPQAVISVGKDITLRKQAELALQRAKDQLEESIARRTTELRHTSARLEELVAHSPAVIYSSSPAADYDLTTITENVIGLLGFRPEQFCADPGFWKSHIHTEDAGRVLAEIERGGREGRITCEYRFLHQDGTYRWIHDERKFMQDAAGRPVEVFGSWVDVTERRLAEETYRALVDQSTMGFVLYQEGKILFCNQAFSDMVGLTITDVLTAPRGNILQHIHPDEQKKVIENRDSLYDGNSRMLRYSARIQRSDGTTRLLEFNNKEIEYGPRRTFQAIVIDNTERKMAEDALHQSEARYRTLAEAAHDMIFIIDHEDRIRYVNNVAASQFGARPEELVGTLRSRLFGGDASGRQAESLGQVFEMARPVYAETKTDFPGQAIWLGTWLVPIKDERGSVDSVMGVSRDISQGKLLQQSLQETKEQLEQRVAERTAELVAGNAQLRKLTHEVVIAQEKERLRISRQLHDEATQTLIGLRYKLSAFLSELPGELSSFEDRLTGMIALADRMTERLRSLAHTLRPPVLDLVGLNVGLDDFCQEFSETTGLPVSYQGVQLPVISEEISISLYRFVQEALTNVLKHAQAGEARVVLDYKEEMIILHVEDNGRGFAQNSRPKGTGLLGLEERIDLLGGRLEIRSEPGQGTFLAAFVPAPARSNPAREDSEVDPLS